MPITCPACRKVNEDQDSQSSACTRCGCDLTALREIADQAALHLSLAADCLRNLDWSTAFNHASHSWGLIPSPAAAHTAFLATLALQKPKPLALWLTRALPHPKTATPHPSPPQSSPTPLE